MTESKPKLTGYLATIAAAVPGLTEAEYRDIEDIMRHTIFHSTLDWQTAAQLKRAARQARQVQIELAKLPAPQESTPIEGRCVTDEELAEERAALSPEDRAKLDALPGEAPPDELLARIAKDTLGIPTLESRNSDRLDFYDLGVSSIKAALEAAWKAGRAAQ